MPEKGLTPMPKYFNKKILFAGVSVPERETTVEVLEREDEGLDRPWRVILYNDHIHTFDEVILQLIKAIRCTAARAEAYALEAHSRGKAGVFEGRFEACLRVQGVLNEILLVTEIEG